MQVIDKNEVAEAEIRLWELIHRVADGPQLRKAPRLRELFLYLCERTLTGRGEDLHEPVIGAKVFGRSEGYDTGSDNIVRVSVFQLRKKLEQYFEQEGAAEPILVAIPKGRYIVEFSNRSAPASPQNSSPRIEVPVPSSKPRWAWAANSAALLLILLLSIAWWTRGGPAAAQNWPEHARFWKGVFSSDRDVYIVLADSGFGLLQDVTGEPMTLDRYLKDTRASGTAAATGYPPELIQRLIGRQYTSVADAAIAFRLGALAQAYGGPAVVRAARTIDVRDLKTRNLVLLGSARSNPWVELLRDRLHFHVEYEEQPPRGLIRNSSPETGEPAVFRATAMGSQSGEAYGLISYVPNLDRTGVIVSISGTNMEGTEAAAEFLLDKVRFQSLIEHLGRDQGSADFPAFEAVIRANSVAGAGASPTIAASRAAELLAKPVH